MEESGADEDRRQSPQYHVAGMISVTLLDGDPMVIANHSIDAFYPTRKSLPVKGKTKPGPKVPTGGVTLELYSGDRLVDVREGMAEIAAKIHYSRV